MALLPKVEPFLENYGKRLHCEAILAIGTTLVRGTVFFSNMIIKEKMAPGVFQNDFGSTFFSVNE